MTRYLYTGVPSSGNGIAQKKKSSFTEHGSSSQGRVTAWVDALLASCDISDSERSRQNGAPAFLLLQAGLRRQQCSRSPNLSTCPSCSNLILMFIPFTAQNVLFLPQHSRGQGTNAGCSIARPHVECHLQGKTNNFVCIFQRG